MASSIFTTSEIEEMQAENDANLPHTAGLRQGTKTFEPGGTGGAIVWAGGDPTWVEPCRISPASVPQEKLSSGSITNLNEFWVVLAQSVAVPVNSGSTYYRLEITHDIPGLASPLMLYHKGAQFRSYEMMRKELMTTEMPK